jgi:hypothetical protein
MAERSHFVNSEYAVAPPPTRCKLIRPKRAPTARFVVALCSRFANQTEPGPIYAERLKNVKSVIGVILLNNADWEGEDADSYTYDFLEATRHTPYPGSRIRSYVIELGKQKLTKEQLHWARLLIHGTAKDDAPDYIKKAAMEFQRKLWETDEEYYAYLTDRNLGLEQLALEDAVERGTRKERRIRAIKELLTRGISDEVIVGVYDISLEQLQLIKNNT